MASNGVLRRRLRLLLLLCSLGGHAAWQLQPTRWQPAPARCRRSCRASVAAIDGGEQVAPLVQSHGNTSASETSAAAETLLNALDSWMRLQTIESVLPRAQAKALLLDLRDDRRFWAQQRTQFNVVWVSLEKALRVEERPLSELLGEMTSDRLLDAIEEMDDDPALINAVRGTEDQRNAIAPARPARPAAAELARTLSSPMPTAELLSYSAPPPPSAPPSSPLRRCCGARSSRSFSARSSTRASSSLCSAPTCSATSSRSCHFWARSACKC